MKSFRCAICGYIHNGDNPPEVCSICGASASDFELFVQPAAPKENLETSPINESSEEKGETGTIIILGGGIAGLAAAEEIRKKSKDTHITIISAEKQLPYYRLNLTRYLAQEVNKNNLTIHPHHWYTENRIKLMSGQEAQAIKTATKQVELQDGTVLTYDKLIIAMGAYPFIPPITGSNLKNVVTIRTVEDAEYVLKRLPVTTDCICIGGGILGLETAGAIAKSGMKVTLLESAPWLMPRQLNAQGAAILKQYLAGIHIDVRENTKIKEIMGQDFCQGIMMEGGEIIPAGLVIITAGVKPNTDLAKKTGLEVDHGLVVNHYMQTSDDNIFAAGDITECHSMIYGLWNVAQYQGKIAALNALGIETQFGGVPRSSILKVLGIDLFSIGNISPIDESCYQYAQEEPGRYFNFFIRDGTLVGSIIIGDNALAIKVKKAVENAAHFPHDVYQDAASIIRKLQE